MNHCIAVVQYRPLEELPPVMTLLTVLKRIGQATHYIGIESTAGKAFLEKTGIEYSWIPYNNYRKANKLSRFLGFIPRRHWLLRKFSELSKRYSVVTPWYQECHSAALAGDGASKFGRAITTFFEYECNYGEKWFGFNLEKMLHTNTIVECEKNRALLTQKNHNLSVTPFVLPNKAEIDDTAIPALNDEAKEVFEKIGKRPVFLYQGYVAGDRKDLPYILETLAKYRPNYCVLSLPGSDYLNKLLAPYPNAFTLKRIPAPGHLAVTAKASVGIAVYNAEGNDNWAINARNCAPNKIYEYAAFGVPTLGNKIPGLESTIGAAHAGILSDMTADAILAAADDLVANLKTYSENARQFYISCDLDKIVSQIIENS